MSAITLVGWGVALLVVGAVAALVVSRRRRLAGWVSFAFAATGSLALLAAAIRVAIGGSEPGLVVATVPGLGAALTVALDPLSAFFLAVVALVGSLATLYSVEYMTHFERDGVAKFYPVLLVFLAAIVGVLVAADFLTFLVLWELMTLTGFFLVTFERESAATQRAGLKFFILTHAGTLAMLAAVLVLWRHGGSFEWSVVKPTLAALVASRPWLGHLVLALLFLAFATKAGVLPMGDWLPDAHPAAPSGVSAALSGVLVKLGIYGLIRVFFALLGGSVPWGMVLALAGTVSLFVGTLTALRQNDTKRLMAFSTIGQIGYICLALGVAVAMVGGSPLLGTLALVAALFHVANHACFKSCLFLGAGAVQFRTGQRDMDRLGGLSAAMPVTASSTTVAALAIAGVPPLNGFASKWLIIVACVLAGLTSPLFLVLALVALFISLVTLAAFMKIVGAVFLGPSAGHTGVREVPWAMWVPQVVLAAACVGLGLFPRVALSAAHRAVASIFGATPPLAELLGHSPLLAVVVGPSVVAAWAPLVFLLVFAAATVLVAMLQRSGGAEVREVPVWAGGEVHAEGELRVAASGLFRPFNSSFAGLYPVVRWRVPAFPGWLRRILDLDRWLFEPTGRLVERTSAGVSRSHVGVPQVYLLWIVGGAAVVLAAVLGLVR